MMLSAIFHECLAVMLSLWVDLQEAGFSIGKLVAMAIAAAI